MVNIRAQPPSGSPRAAEVGEIDTRAPFQSVRAAVSLFGAVATIKSKAPSLPSFKRQSSAVSESAKPNPTPSANGKLSQETRLMLALKELDKYKTKLENAEAAKASTMADLETSRRALEELNMKIMAVQESKHSVIESMEEAKHHATNLEEVTGRDDITADGPWMEELEQAREQYAVVARELHSTKQCLAKLRQDFDAAMEEKMAALQQASDSHCASKAHTEKTNDLQKEIASMQESIEHLKFETRRSSKVKVKIVAERESLLQSYRPAKEEAERKMKVMKSEFNPEMVRILEQQYAETTAEIQEVKEQMRWVLTSEITSVKDITEEVNKAKKALEEVSAEETSLRASVDSLRTELESVKDDFAQAEMKEKEVETLSANLKEQLKGCKAELEGLADFHEDELFSRLHRLLSGTNVEKRAEEEIKRNIIELRKEIENAHNTRQEAERQLQGTAAELKEAREGENHAADQLRTVSTVCTADFGTGSAKIRMSKKDYENLNRKHEEADNLAEMKVAAVMFQVGAISAKKSEADIQVDMTLKEIDRMQAVIEFALKQAEASETAQKEIEAELERWRKQE